MVDVSGPVHRRGGDFAPPLDEDGDVYRRRILVRAVDERTVVSELEDDFHHFVVTLRHDGGRVVSVHNESHRWPWATCPAAGAHLDRLVGMELTTRFTGPARYTSAHENCTHQFDAASHAVTHAAWGRAVRQYDAEVGALLRADAPRHNRLWVDGSLALDWVLQAGRGPVEPLPAPYGDGPWKGGFMRWADEALDPETAETAIVLRRACDIGMGRGMPLDDIAVATELMPGMNGVCHSMQPDIAPDGVRNSGSIRDFAAHPELLCTPPDTPRPRILATTLQ